MLVRASDNKRMKNNPNLPLGKTSDYPSTYAPEVLFAIERKLGRDHLAIDANKLPFLGFDRWTAYELSWLNQKGLPQVAIAEFDFPCDSPCIIESKSFKLYLNSINNHCFNDQGQLLRQLQSDLSRASGAEVNARLFDVNNYPLMKLDQSQCLDDQAITCSVYSPTAELLAFESDSLANRVHRLCFSDLLRSLCPVTSQPDWASVFIEYKGRAIDRAALLRYIVSYRNHQGFHEQCVESIFTDIAHFAEPDFLQVCARFSRRGGLDINPLRCSSSTFSLASGRLTKQ